MNPNLQSNPVSAWVDQLVIPTYPVFPPEPNPMFYEKRNIQGSAGNVYPIPVTDRLSSQKQDQTWEVVYLENEYIQLVMLPALGGRVFGGLDKTNGYNFFYRHRVIKPALISLLGPWISGGMEFNWPQHHRPSTYMPAEYTIEEHLDGKKTVWMSEHEPTNRMKGMVGICLHPGKALVEMKVQLYNRTPYVQTFLWWANAAVHINEDYQVFFPPDVHYAVFHTKRPVCSFPIARGIFNSGLDFGDGTDVTWYKNMDIPTSFFAAPSKYNFFGGYDHRRDAGVVHIANSHISPGKKFFTWANGPFGHQWQHNLTDYDDPYLELMAGVYTDNQPDFSWLYPYETKNFSQYWFPIQKVGPVKNANTQAAVSLEVEGKEIKIGVLTTESFPGAAIRLFSDQHSWYEAKADLDPGRPFVAQIELLQVVEPTSLLLQVMRSDGSELIRYIPEAPGVGSLPEPYQPPPSPAETKTVEELYLVGLHLYQYRHPAIEPEPYWEEALRRDPGNARCNNAVGLSYLRLGDFVKAEMHFRKALDRLTWRNQNPYDCEAHYNLGLALRYQDQDEEAYAEFYRAIWDYAWQNAGYYALAEIDLRHGRYTTALEHATRSLQTNTMHLKARNLKAAILRRLGQLGLAEAFVRETITMDPLDHWSHNELVLALRAARKDSEAETEIQKLRQIMRADAQNYLDLATDYGNAGLYHEASDLLSRVVQPGKAVYPMVLYYLGYFARQMGETEKAYAFYQQATQQPPDYCFPWRLEEMCVLRDALKTNPADGRAHYYLGNLLYDKKHSEEAIQLWEKATQLEPGFSIPWRNLGLAAYNVQKDAQKALAYYQRAFQVNPNDPRVLFELDQIRKRLAVLPEERLAALESSRQVVLLRDDLTIQLAALYNRTEQPEKALSILNERSFFPWEGGEGQVSACWSTAHLLLGKAALKARDVPKALEYFEKSNEFPYHLGEASYGEFEAAGLYYSGLAKEKLGEEKGARASFQQVLEARADFWPTNWYYRGLALLRLGKPESARSQLMELLEAGKQTASQTFIQNYFFPQLPCVTFIDDPNPIKLTYGQLLQGLANLGLSQVDPSNQDFYFSEARKAFIKVLEADPSHQDAWEVLQQLI